MLEGPVYNLVTERISDAKIQNDCNPQISGYPFVKCSFRYLDKDKQLEYLGWDYRTQFKGSFVEAEKKSGMLIGVMTDGNNRPPMPHEIELPRLRLP